MIFKDLDEHLAFAVEFHGKKLRLIVYEDGVEKVCRKETLKNLKAFIKSGENHLFKGRLQLSKIDIDTAVLVKGKLLGTFNSQRFLDWIDDH